jgi:hypothetical protein
MRVRVYGHGYTNHSCPTITAGLYYASSWHGFLHPGNLGPVTLENGKHAPNLQNLMVSASVESLNLLSSAGRPVTSWRRWSREVKSNPVPQEHPRCRAYWWNGELYTPAEFRWEVYIPHLIKAFNETTVPEHFAQLRKESKRIALNASDGWNHTANGHTISDIINDNEITVPCVFLIAAILENDWM